MSCLKCPHDDAARERERVIIIIPPPEPTPWCEADERRLSRAEADTLEAVMRIGDKWQGGRELSKKEVQADCICIVYPRCVCYRGAEEVQVDCMCIVYPPGVCVIEGGGGANSTLA